MKHISALMKFKKIWLLKPQNKDKENCCKNDQIWIKQNFKYTEKCSLNLLLLNLRICLTINLLQIKVNFFFTYLNSNSIVIPQFLYIRSYSSWWQSTKVRHTVLLQTLNYKAHLLPKLIILEKHHFNFHTEID